MKHLKYSFACFLLLLCSMTTWAIEGRVERNIDFNWYFLLGDTINAQEMNFSENSWRTLDLPHDWSIEGTYSQDYPGKGQMGWLPGGVGWYRKNIDWDPTWKDKKVSITFDGVFMNSQVWINGHLLGYRPYGYTSFAYDLTPYLNMKRNVIAVKVDNSLMPSARWYTGSGIYRHVNLIITEPIHVARHGVFVTTPEITTSKALVKVETTVENETGDIRNITLTSIILNDKKDIVAQTKKSLTLDQRFNIVANDLTVTSPTLWNPDSPRMYYSKTIISENNKVIDTYITPFGIRKIEFGAAYGFKLNDKPLKLKGVCIHQDAGPTGIAVPEDVWHRRLLILKEMGCNAVRTAHHPFPSEFYTICDTMGLMVMNEVFDGWYHWDNFGKAKWDYGHYFLEWWERDLEEFVKRDRNHPAVIMWSMGNEVWGHESRLDLQKKIYDLYKKYDPTRPVTQAWSLKKYIDIAGFNANGESIGGLSDFHKNNPNMPAVGTEIPHTRQTRGTYRTKTSYNPWDKPDEHGGETSAENRARLFPLPDLTKEEIFAEFDARYASGYDNQTRKIGIREAWKQVRDNAFYIGDFRWTGFDYLGESWGWPSRTNNYGVIDLAGFPKDAYYLYQSLWSEKPMVHLLPHWNWPNKLGVSIPVVAYTNGDAAELFFNGKSLGKKIMSSDTLQIVWYVPYKPGTLEVVAYKNGKSIARDKVETSGQASAIKLSVDKMTLNANKRDVVHVVVDIIDTKGKFVPDANEPIEFEVTGPYKLIGVENGDILDMNPQKILSRKTFMGKALLILQATDKGGVIRVKANAHTLKTGIVEVEVLE